MWGCIQVLWKILFVFTWFFWLLITFLGPFFPVLTRHVFHLEQSSRHQQRHLWHRPKFSEQAVLHYCGAQLGCLTKFMWSWKQSLSLTWQMSVLAPWPQLNWHSQITWPRLQAVAQGPTSIISVGAFLSLLPISFQQWQMKSCPFVALWGLPWTSLKSSMAWVCRPIL